MSLIILVIFLFLNVQCCYISEGGSEYGYKHQEVQNQKIFELVQSIQNRSIDKIQDLLSEDQTLVNKNYLTCSGGMQSPLWFALEQGDDVIAKLLLDHGAGKEDVAFVFGIMNCLEKNQDSLSLLLLQYGSTLTNSDLTYCKKYYPVFYETAFEENIFRDKLGAFNKESYCDQVTLLRQLLLRSKYFWPRVVKTFSKEKLKQCSQLCEIMETDYTSDGIVSYAEKIHYGDDSNINILHLFAGIGRGADLSKQNKDGFNALHLLAYGDNDLFSQVISFASEYYQVKMTDKNNYLIYALLAPIEKKNFSSEDDSTPCDIVVKKYLKNSGLEYENQKNVNEVRKILTFFSGKTVKDINTKIEDLLTKIANIELCMRYKEIIENDQ